MGNVTREIEASKVEICGVEVGCVDFIGLYGHRYGTGMGPVWAPVWAPV
ncbi:hypothetical protein [Bartonella phoceensis]|nr:hypothetical protein [Bartonella phoceensis]